MLILILQLEARKAKLPDFWLPSLTPHAKAAVADIKDLKLHTVCNAGDPKYLLLCVIILVSDIVIYNSVDPKLWSLLSSLLIPLQMLWPTP